MDIRELTTEEIRDIYGKHLTRDFPKDELKPLDRIESSVRVGQYRCIGAFEKTGEFLAYAFFVLIDKNALLDYYDVVPEKRGEGKGSEFLRQAVKFFETDMMLIEIEDPESGPGSEALMRAKRKKFYLNAGALDTGVQVTAFGVDFLLLEYPTVRVHTKEEIATAYMYIYRTILPPKMFDRNMKLR